MNVTRGYVLGLSVWVLAAGCQRSLGDSATGQVAGASGAKLLVAGRGGSEAAARTINFAEVARSPDARTTGPISGGRSRIPRAAPAGAASVSRTQGVLGVAARDSLAAANRSLRGGGGSLPLRWCRSRHLPELHRFATRSQRRCRGRQDRPGGQ